MTATTTATPATVIQIADSVVAEINAGEFSKRNLAAQRLYVPNFDLEDMKELRVTVVPREVEYLPLDRVSNKLKPPTSARLVMPPQPFG